MPRLHLFEFEDQTWLPTTLRNYMTDFLREVFSYLVPRVALEESLARLLNVAESNRILDLASGGSGPIVPVWQRLKMVLGRPVQVRLTDRYPNQTTHSYLHRISGGEITYFPEPVDARTVPGHLEGVRTLFTAFHHFRPQDARQILADAVARGRPIAIFEATERSPKMLAITTLVPLLVWFTTAYMRPIEPRRWLFTYLIPVVPLLALWDGWVSCLRTYSPRELAEFTASIPQADWTWEIGFLPVRGLPCRTSYLLGYPSRTASGRTLSSAHPDVHPYSKAEECGEGPLDRCHTRGSTVNS